MIMHIDFDAVAEPEIEQELETWALVWFDGTDDGLLLTINDPYNLLMEGPALSEARFVVDSSKDAGLYLVKNIHPVNINRDWETGVVDYWDLSGDWSLVTSEGLALSQVSE